MRSISSLSDYKSIIAEAKSEGFVLTNCFFLPSSVQEKIDQKKLLFESADSGIILLEDEKDFYRFYYYLAPEKNPPSIELDKPAVIELPFQDHFKLTQIQQVNLIHQMGFELGRESAAMVLSVESVQNIMHAESTSRVSFARKSDCVSVSNLLRKAFNPLYSFLPSDEELLQDINEGKVWVINDSGYLAGCLRSEVEKSYASIAQIAVDPEYRGRGYGNYLIETYHQYYKEKVRNFQHWVDLNNQPAVNMYRKWGYIFNGRRANEFIKS